MKPRQFFVPSLLALAASSVPLQAQLLITEIQSSQAAASTNDYWELTNVGATAVDLSGWKWNDIARVSTGSAVVTIPNGTSIAAGESVIFTALTPTAFRTWWPNTGSVQVISTGAAPGLGQNDAISLFNAAGVEICYLPYAANGFTRATGSGAAGGHAGLSAGGTSATQAMVLDPAFGTSVAGRRYAAAAVGTAGGFASSASALDIGSPGTAGLSAAPAVTLAVSVSPASFPESSVNPAATGSVSRVGSTASDLVVTLASSDTTEATVPATVTILANQTSADFAITAVDDSFPDGNKLATLTASAAGATSGTATVTVLDDGDVLSTKLLLTEVSSSASATAPVGANDYWELTNFGATAVSLTGYSWHDSGRSSAAAVAFPAGASIAAGESVIVTAMTAANFRSWWGLAQTVQVFETPGAPGLGKGDGVSLFEPGKNELFFFNYAGGGFLLESGAPSTAASEHTGLAGGGAAESQALVWVPSSGTASPRYAASTGSNFDTLRAATGSDLGSPGRTLAVSSVSLASASVSEGNSGSSTLALNVTRNQIDSAFSVDYAVTGGTATSGSDYAILASGTLTFTSAGGATQPIDLTVNGDSAFEPDETVIVTLSNVVNITGTTTIGTATGTGTILNDDAAAPLITSQPVSVSIGSGAYTTLTLGASGSPAPTVQWYQGVSGNTGTPVGSNSVSFTTPALTATTRYWARVSNAGGDVDTDTVTVSLGTTPTTVDLSRYVRIGRYDLPEPTRTALPAGTPLSNLLCQEASGVAYNWDSGTLFIICDGGRSVTQVSKTGQLVDTMTLDLQAGAPQGTAFYDPEGITYVGNGQFVFGEERDRQLVKFTYAAGTTLTRAAAQTVDLGTFVNNIGIEGLSFDPQTGGFVCVKEISPQGVFQTGVDFTAGTATNGSPTTTDSVDLFDPALAGFLDLADVFALSNLPYLGGQPQSGNLLLLSQASARIVNIDRSGSIASSLQIAADPGSPLSVADQQHEGLVMDRDGILYVVNENGGGDIDHPQLWVYAPSAVPNQAPSAVALNNALSSIVENTPTVAPIKVADLVVTDDGLGTNSLSLTGTDAAFFEITGSSLYLKAGSVLDYETKSSYAVTVQVDDTTLGATPDASANFALAITNIVDETPVAPSVFISEVHPTGSSNTSYLADWFEVTNAGTTAVNISGWQMDDSSNGTVKLTLRGVTSIPAGKSAIFFEGLADGSTDAAKIAAFSTAWFGTSTPPAGFLIGAYGGSGAGLSSTGDAMNLFAADGARITGVAFGAAVLGTTFDNHAALGSSSLPLPTISTSSVAGVHGAFLSANATETGSPGTTGKLLITEVAPWSSGSSVAADWFELTNTGATAVDLTGWKMDDNSESPVAAVALNGITRVAPGESVIFVETATPLTTLPAFLSNWFGANPPAGMQVGSYTGSGVSLSGSGDAVNLYDGISTTPQANVSFGASPTGPFATFDNIAGLNFASVSTLSAVGVQGAFHAVNSASQIGSPGPQFIPAAGSFSAWLAARAYTSAGIDTDSDGDGLTDRVEFFFNLSPNRPAGFGNLPAVVPNGANRELHFRRLASVVGTQGTLRCSSDLQGVWPAAVLGVDYEVIREINVGEETEVAYRLLGNESTKFFRFAIE